AGMGDVLTGVIAALLAQGLDAFDAAACGALLHACAGDLAAVRGERGLLPRDLLPELRRLANLEHAGCRAICWPRRRPPTPWAPPGRTHARTRPLCGCAGPGPAGS